MRPVLEHPDHAAATDKIVHASSTLHDVEIWNARVKVPNLAAKLHRLPNFNVYTDAELKNSRAAATARDFQHIKNAGFGSRKVSHPPACRTPRRDQRVGEEVYPHAGSRKKCLVALRNQIIAG